METIFQIKPSKVILRWVFLQPHCIAAPYLVRVYIRDYILAKRATKYNYFFVFIVSADSQPIALYKMTADVPRAAMKNILDI